MPQVRRPVKREVSFTEDEFASLAGRARLAKRPFARFVREAALGHWIVVPPNRFDRAVLFDLNRVGNHLGRIADAVGADADPGVRAELDAALADHRALMASLFAVIRASRGSGPADAAGDRTEAAR